MTGSVLLVAPEHFTTSRLDAVVRRKAAWIVQRLRHVQSHDPPPSPREFVSGERSCPAAIPPRLSTTMAASRSETTDMRRGHVSAMERS